MKRLDHYWYSQNPVAWLLLPLSWLFCVVAILRRQLYRIGILRQHSLPVPVIVIGNISVGGTGKTPLIIALSQLLARQGFKAGVISRGYGSNISGVHKVSANDDAAVCGDEPLLIKIRTGLPVVIGSDRVAAAEYLLDHYDCDVLLSDDGMQHYRMQRDVEIAVVDSTRMHGNGFCIPAGPLREPVSRLQQVDMVVFHGDDTEAYHFILKIDQCKDLVSGIEKPLTAFEGIKVHAVAGIGHPQRFFSQLKARGIEIIEHPFPDHHIYSATDFEFDDGLAVLMTEKDAVKCVGLELENAWSVRANASLSSKLKEDIISLVPGK